jgi:chromosome segregation ATPase
MNAKGLGVAGSLAQFRFLNECCSSGRCLVPWLGEKPLSGTSSTTALGADSELGIQQHSSALESQLKFAQDKLKQNQQTAEPASKERSALESRLKEAQERLQQAQQSAELASTQRSALESQLKLAQDKLKQNQQTAELAWTERSALQIQLKQANNKLQQFQQATELASTERSALDAKLRKAEENEPPPIWRTRELKVK